MDEDRQVISISRAERAVIFQGGRALCLILAAVVVTAEILLGAELPDRSHGLMFVAVILLVGYAMSSWHADRTLIRVRRDQIRSEAALRQRIDDVLAGQAAITARFLAVVDDVRREMRAGRAPRTAPPRRRGRKSTAPATPIAASFAEILDGSNVIRLPSAESMRAVANIARKVVEGGGFKINGDSRGDTRTERNGWEGRGSHDKNA